MRVYNLGPKDSGNLPLTNEEKHLTTQNPSEPRPDGPSADRRRVDRAERSLRESEERFRRVITQTKAGYFLIDREGRFVQVNDAWLGMHGYESAEEVVGRHFSLTQIEDDLPAAHEIVETIFAGGPVPDGEFSRRCRDGSVGYHTFTLSPVFEQGEVVGLEGFLIDTTGLKRAEADYQTLFREMLDGCALHEIVCDAQGEPVDYRFLAVNPAFESMTGLNANDIVGHNVLEVLPGTERHWIQTYGKVALTGMPVFFESYHAQLDKHFQVTAFQPAPHQFACIFTDITERKKAEDRLRLTQVSVDSAMVMVALTGADGRLLYVNDAFCSGHGYSRGELLGMTIFDLDPEMPAEAWPDRWRQDRERGAAAFEVAHRTKGGEIFPMEVMTYFMERDGEEINVGFARDITERKRAEEALRQAEDQLRQSQKMEAVGQLAGGIAHDFNNLLTAVLGYSDLVLASPELTGSSVRDDVEQIKHAAERAAALTRQILAFSRRQALTTAVVSLNDVLAGMELLLRRTLGEDIDLVGVQHFGLGHVEVDVHQFEQVLMNLALNARDAMPQGGRLTVETGNVELGEEYCRTHSDATPGKYVMLSVSDTGVGMDSNTMAHMFEPFFTTKAAGEGTGLGLSTVYGIVKQSGGSIFVRSEPGKGTEFKLYLPRTASQVEKEVPASTVEG